MHWVRPELVAQVSFMEWTSSGGIRHAVFEGLREDKPRDRGLRGGGGRASGEERPLVTRASIINGVTLTHPDRVYWPHEGITKRDLVEHYDRVASVMLPYVAGRPVAMVRCPGGLVELPEGRAQRQPASGRLLLLQTSARRLPRAVRAGHDHASPAVRLHTSPSPSLAA